MRLTTRIALALFAGVILALTIYAYPSWAGFLTLVFRAAAILGMLVLVAVLIASLTKRRPGGFDLILTLAAVGTVIASWSQVSAVADAHKFDAEIAEAGEENIMTVLANTETHTGGLVRAVVELRDSTNNDVAFDIDTLWDADRFAALIGPDALDEAKLADATDRIALLAGAVEQTRGGMHTALDDEINAITRIDTKLPDSERLSLVDVAVRHVEADRTYFTARIDIARDRLASAAEIAALLQANAGAFSFDPATRMLSFNDAAVAANYEQLVAAIEATWAEEQNLAVARDAGAHAEIMALIEAAETTP